ncbi:MAG: FtsQ-type POTRA domain-containing protein, partial [Clostridia bacterium]|nr:FtsQ-type POTRA domain-containing protein [Clostridia bacterium]
MRNKKLIILLCILFVVTLLVVLSSVLFTVQDVYGYCYNDDDETFDIEIAKFETNGLSRGKSIFFVNEEEVISAVESKYPDVNVINVERKFPNIIYINYVKIFPYLVFETEEDALLVSNDCKILSSQAKESEYDDYVLIKGVTAPSSTTVGEGLYGENTTDYKVVSQIMDVMER